MFVSNSAFEFSMPEELTQPNSKCWRALELSLNASWFVATLRSLDEEESYRRTLIVSWEVDLLQIVETLIDGYLEALLLMAPPWRTDDGRWQTHQIKQIWRAQDAAHDSESALVFTTLEGKQIVGPLADAAPDSMYRHHLLVTVGMPHRAAAHESGCDQTTGESAQKTSE